jgi:putative two-component system response regulator
MAEALDFTAKPTVLVVDDTADNLAVISGLLKDLYKIKVAANGEKALQIARSGTPPDLILLDIMMPELSGYEVCTRLKSDPATSNIPVIFLSALSSADDERKGLELGAEDYVTKPVSPAILLARVKTHLRIKAAVDFLRDKNAWLERELVRRAESDLDFARSVGAIAKDFKAMTEHLTG